MSYDRIDIVHALECWQTHREDAERCKKCGERLYPHTSGAILMCPRGRGEQACQYAVPASSELISQAVTAVRTVRRFGAG